MRSDGVTYIANSQIDSKIEKFKDVDKTNEIPFSILSMKSSCVNSPIAIWGFNAYLFVFNIITINMINHFGKSAMNIIMKHLCIQWNLSIPTP